MNARTKGIINLVLSTMFLALSFTLIRMTGELPSVQKVFFRNCVMIVFSYAALRKEQVPIKIEKAFVVPLILRGIMGTLSMFCNFYAIDHMNLADATMLNKLSPFFTVVFSWLFLKEQLKASNLVALAAAFLGAVFIIKPTGTEGEVFPAILGVLGGVFAGAAFTAIRASSKAGAPQKLIVFSLSVISCAMSFPIMLIEYVSMNWWQFLFIVASGLLSVAGHFCNTRAYANVPASEISVFDYSQVVFSALWGFVLFGQIPDHMSMIGYMIIIGTGVLVFFRNKKINLN